MDISIFLAKVIGLYLVIISFAFIRDKHYMKTIVMQIMDNGALHFILYFNVLIVGILLVLTHNIWEPSWRVLITLIAWITLFKAILNICFPKTAIDLAKPMLASGSALNLSFMINLFLGLILCFYGFTPSNWTLAT